MQLKDLKPASQIAANMGVKSILFGPPGSAKTPMVLTAPRPVLCAIEPGLKSIRNSNVPTWEAYDAKRLDEFFEWITRSSEIKNFDTIWFDSISQGAELVLGDMQGQYKNGKQAYGKFAEKVMQWMNQLFYMPQKHIVLLAKEGFRDKTIFTVENGIPKQVEIKMSIPYFPGQELNIKIPHLFDETLYSCKTIIPRVGEVRALRTRDTETIFARDRSGMLNEYEEPNFTALFNKAMQ
jgi:hypothetical protein